MPDKPSDWNVTVNQKLDRIVMKCIDFAPAKRYQTAMELLEALEAWKPGGKVSVKESLSSSTMKSILGEGSGMDEAKGREMAKDARKLAREGMKMIITFVK